MKLIRLYYTLKDLRWPQFWYRLWYPIKRQFYINAPVPNNIFDIIASWPTINLHELPVFDKYEPKENAFTLLNIRQDFSQNINWNFKEHGMLWLYHLNYFAWLGDESLSVEDRLKTLQDYANANLIAGTDSYPISIRGLAIIRFCLKHGVKDQRLITQLHQHYHKLYHFPEYQLQGNHLWQNACSLIAAGYFFKNQNFLNKGQQILLKAFKEQILNDGAHIEGSPMYHSLLLSSLLQCIELETMLNADDERFQKVMRTNASLMLGWLMNISFKNGEWPQINDSTRNVAPTLKKLKNFAEKLAIYPLSTPLSESGVRKYTEKDFELFVNAGSIQPTWQPGHAHSHELSFCLNINGDCVIVDPGISTYENSSLRHWQRSTDAHNTLSVSGNNKSDVWKSFRVGKKAHVSILKESDKYISIENTSETFIHTRNYLITPEIISLEDIITSGKEEHCFINFHFSPNIILKKYGDYEFLAGNLQLVIKGCVSAKIELYDFAGEFNKVVPAQRIHIQTGNHTITTLRILNAD